MFIYTDLFEIKYKVDFNKLPVYDKFFIYILCNFLLKHTKKDTHKKNKAKCVAP